MNDQRWDRVVRMYGEGATIRNIMDSCQISKSEVYYILKRRGITPSRQSQPHVIDAAALTAQLMQAHETIGILRQALADCGCADPTADQITPM